MTSEQRKLRRKQEKEAKKQSKKELKEKVGLFDKIPEECLTCNAKFDKTDKEQVMTWSVVVRKQEGIVRLYCPDCWSAAKKLIEEVNVGHDDTKSNV